MRTWFQLPALLIMMILAACASGTSRSTDANALVDASRWTVESFKTGKTDADQAFRANLKTAQGVVIFPTTTKLAFVIGAEGGSGVLVARNADGTWGYPAFYTMGGPSFGLQGGAVSSELILVLRSRGAVDAVLNNQGKFGGDIQMIAGDFGRGAEAATTTNLGADVVGFSHGQGLFAGVSLEGAAIVKRNDLNTAYYGTGATPTAIVRDGKFSNPQATPLREVLIVE